MIAVGPEKIISISKFRREGEESGDVSIFICGLETLRNPITCVEGKPESMTDLAEVLGKLLGVKVRFDKAGD